MKGLLIKDLKLMYLQKNFFFAVFIIVIGLFAVGQDMTFPFIFFICVIALFNVSTISYDEYDNGYPFLFTLPITRKTYVLEKYLLGLCLSVSAWLISMLLALGFAYLKQTADLKEVLFNALPLLSTPILIQILTIPFQLKFGSEKGRIAMFGAFGLVFLAGSLLAQWIQTDHITAPLNFLAMMTGTHVVILILIIVLTLFLLSLTFSLMIFKQKEF